MNEPATAAVNRVSCAHHGDTARCSDGVVYLRRRGLDGGNYLRGTSWMIDSMLAAGDHVPVAIDAFGGYAGRGNAEHEGNADIVSQGVVGANPAATAPAWSACSGVRYQPGLCQPAHAFACGRL